MIVTYIFLEIKKYGNIHLTKKNHTTSAGSSFKDFKKLTVKPTVTIIARKSAEGAAYKIPSTPPNAIG